MTIKYIERYKRGKRRTLFPQQFREDRHDMRLEERLIVADHVKRLKRHTQL